MEPEPTSTYASVMTEGQARRKQDDMAGADNSPDLDRRSDSGEAPLPPAIFWGSRLGMTVWFAVSVVMGLLGFSYWASVPMVAVGTVLYQGFNGLPRPWLNEATLRILFYSGVGMSLVFFSFFATGRLVRWLFV